MDFGIGEAMDGLINMVFIALGAFFAAATMVVLAIWVPVSWWMFGSMIAGGFVGYWIKRVLFRD